jgi:phosphate starvation-inducible protein PhoH
VKAVAEIRQFLRPDFERVVTRSTAVTRSEDSIVALTEDQYQVLDVISDNPRCLVDGAAGTGKTVLALEYAKRASSSNRRILLLCYNRHPATSASDATSPPVGRRLSQSWTSDGA